MRSKAAHTANAAFAPFFVLQSKTKTKNDVFVWYAFLLLVLVYAQPLSYAQPKGAYW